MADMDGILEVEMRYECRDIGGIGVHLVADIRLGRAAMAAPIVGDDAVALCQEEQHLGVPVVAAQWPAMMEDDGLTGSPVLVENLRAVLGGDRAAAGSGLCLRSHLNLL